MQNAECRKSYGLDLYKLRKHYNCFSTKVLQFAKLYNPKRFSVFMFFGLSNRCRRFSLVATTKIIHRMIFVCDTGHWILATSTIANC